MELENVHVLVTGACGGIGQAIVLEFLDCGAKVTGLDIRENTSGNSQRVQYFSADMRDEDQIKKAFNYATKAFGPVQVLVANAGITDESQSTDIVDMSYDHWRNTYHNNVDGTFITVREFLRGVRSSKVSKNIAIVITGSETAVFGQAGHGDYASGKSALQYGLVKTLKNEITKIVPTARVNAVAPGWVQTPLM